MENSLGSVMGGIASFSSYFSFYCNIFSISSALALSAFSLSSMRVISFFHCFYFSMNFSSWDWHSVSLPFNLSLSLSSSDKFESWINWVARIFSFFFSSWMVSSFSFNNICVLVPLSYLFSSINKSIWSFLISAWRDLFSTLCCLSWFSTILFLVLAWISWELNSTN